jgi:hypothetical protein
VPEKGDSYDPHPPSDCAFAGVTGSASAREKHMGIQGLDEDASCDDDDPDD